jgi:hypothetical protein
LDSELVAEDPQQSLESSSIIQEIEEQPPPSEEVYEPAPKVQEIQEVQSPPESASDSSSTHGNGSFPASSLHIELPKMLEANVEKLVQQEVQRILPAAVNEELRAQIKTLFAQL